MKSIIKVKSTKSGVLLVSDEDASFEDIKGAVRDKFISSASFFKDAKVTIGFDGKKLSDKEKFELIDIISEITDIDIICIAEDDPELENRLNRSLTDKQNMIKKPDNKTGQFYKGNLLSGQVIDFETSVVVLGDVCEGARIASKGNIVILGKLSGYAFAGAGGDEKAFVAALSMEEAKIRICDSVLESSDKKKFKIRKHGPMMAICQDGKIYKKSIKGDSIANIQMD